MALNTQITSTSAINRQVVYTANNGNAKIQQMTVHNSDGVSAFDIFVYIKTDSTVTGTLIEIQEKSVAINGAISLDLVIGHIVPSGGTIQAHSTSATALYMTISGIERQNVN